MMGVVDFFGTHGKGWVSVMMGVVDSFACCVWS